MKVIQRAENLSPEKAPSCMKIYDITVPLQASVAEWPGDTPYTFDRISKLEEGETVNLGSVSMSVHAGTHADAPYHFLEAGASVDALDPEVYMGPAYVIDLRGREAIRRADLLPFDLTQTPRVLFRTDAWTDYTRFPETIPVMEPDVPDHLQAHGVKLIGVDVPSVDRIESKDLPIHRALAARGIHILEALRLVDVQEGRYELLALPLKLVGADGAPVRAVLRQP